MTSFFENAKLLEYIKRNSEYREEPIFTGLKADFTEDLNIACGYYEMMFSFYAGFVSQACKKIPEDGRNLSCE
ncbi:MAG: hypothetical protein JW969_01385 [Spirochaetales bacterium]|nr:hypothetical protein [Spirochaetales bacterium]